MGDNLLESNIIKRREENTKFRTLAKKQWDNIIQLSADNFIQLSTATLDGGHKTRLLDEGAVVNSDGSLRYYLTKGVVKDFYDSIEDDYVGAVKFHFPFEIFPILLGTWSKKDLTLIDKGDGRFALDVNVLLNDNLYIVKDLMSMPFSLPLSVEAPYLIDEEASEKIGAPVITKIFVEDFAIVGDGGNVESNVYALKGEDMAENKAKLGATVTPEDAEKIVEPETEVDGNTETAKDVAVTEEPAADNTEEVSEEEVTEEVEPQAEEPAKEDTDAEPSPLEAVLSLVKEQNERITALEKSNADLRAELSARDTQDKEFASKFKTLTLELSNAQVQKQEVATRKISDGIGEL